MIVLAFAYLLKKHCMRKCPVVRDGDMSGEAV